MSHCVFCLNKLEESESLLVEECSVDNISALELLKTHFDFSDKILEDSKDPKCMCSNCWSHLVSFHEFHTNVSINYGMVQVIQSEGQGEEEAPDMIEQTETDDIIDDENIMAFEEYIEEDVVQVDVEALEECVEEQGVFLTPDLIKQETMTKTAVIQSIPLRSRTSKRANPHPIDPADDAKIRNFAQMNCDVCTRPLGSMSEARLHFRHDHNNAPAYLICCGRQFKQRNRLLDHVNTIHLNLTYQCTFCEKHFDSKGYLMRHLVYHEVVNDTFECDHCPKKFAKKFLVRNHLLSVHAYDNVIPSLACPVEGCEKFFVNDARLKHHIKYYHAAQDTWCCEVCNKGFKTKASLLEHMRTHTRHPEERYQCQICGHYIKELKTYKRHLKNHETEHLDNTCAYCGKKSPNLNALQKHIRFVHETKRTFECRYCEKTFKRPRNLIDHEASVHTMKELYECQFCNKTFRNQSNMLAHRKKTHPDQYKKPAYLRDTVSPLKEENFD